MGLILERLLEALLVDTARGGRAVFQCPASASQDAAASVPCHSTTWSKGNVPLLPVPEPGFDSAMSLCRCHAHHAAHPVQAWLQARALPPGPLQHCNHGVCLHSHHIHPCEPPVLTSPPCLLHADTTLLHAMAILCHWGRGDALLCPAAVAHNAFMHAYSGATSV